MESDSESQDSDDGRRFRFETTRKDTSSTPQPKRAESPHRKKPRSRSRDKREEKSRRDTSRRSRSPKERHKSLKKKHHKDFHRSKEPSRDSDSSGSKHKSRHKKRSREKSQERNTDDTSKKEKMGIEVPVEKKKFIENTEKVFSKSVDESICSTVLANRVLNTTASVRKKTKSFFDRVVNKETNDDDNSFYGPALPPQLERKLINTRESQIETDKTAETIVKDNEKAEEIVEKVASISDEKQATYLALLPISEDKQIVDPTLPLNLLAVETDNNDENGPQIQKRILGPTLPMGFLIPENIPSKSLEVEERPNSDEDDIDAAFGPLPSDHPAARDNQVQMQLEYRAMMVKQKMRDKTSPEKSKREEWMTELPPAHAVAIGLGSIPRKFKASEGPDMSDRSMWTDTPEDKLRKQKEKEYINRFVHSEDSSIKSTEEHKNKTDKPEEKSLKKESLLDMHLKTLKKKKKKLEKEAKELGLSTRRPFDRDVDMQVNRLDEARKKKIFEKASKLNDRFTIGKI